MRRRERDAAQDAFAGCPRLPPLHFDDWPEFLNYAVSLHTKGELDDLVDLQVSLLWEGIAKHWRVQRAIEMMVAEAREAFDGGDPWTTRARRWPTRTGRRNGISAASSCLSRAGRR